jgi:hypothetical protein
MGTHASGVLNPRRSFLLARRRRAYPVQNSITTPADGMIGKTRSSRPLTRPLKL